MNKNNLQFYNLGALEKIPGYDGKGLVRIPSDVRNKLNERARTKGMDSVGIEVRFVTDAPNVDLTISMQPLNDKTGEIYIYKGNFLHEIVQIPTGKVKLCRISSPSEFDLVNEKMVKSGGCSPNVWRIVCNRSLAIFHGINTFGHNIRPPKKEELPKYNWLAYGSSITNSNLQGYPHFAASLMKVQVQNKGLCGSCHIEKEMVDYLLDDCYFDFITCELGVNMRKKYSAVEFEKRALYLIKRLVGANKPSVIISIFPNREIAEYINVQNEISQRQTEFNQILAKLVNEANCHNLKLINGYEILTDITGLCSDLLHPSAYGHAIMGMNLAKHLKDHLSNCGLEI